MYMPEENGSSYFLCNILTLTFNTTELTFCTPPVSSSSPLVACPDYLPVQKPIKTYSKLSILTYLVTPWNRVLLEELTGSAASQEILGLFGARRFLTVLTSARHLSLS